MSDVLEALKRYFTTGTAEAEGNILNAAFVPMANFVEILNPPHASPRLLIGKKGSGKSAFVRFVKQRMEQADVPLIILKPKDFLCEWPDEPASLGDLTRHSERALLTAIGSVLGSQLNGFITEEQNELRKLAQRAGIQDADFVQQGLRFLKPIGQVLTKIDFEKFASGLPVPPKKLKRLIEAQLASPWQLLYLIIDDTDQLASPSEPNHLNRIWSVMLALRFILEECPHIKAVMTLRTEVWKRMSRHDAGQRDQVDHFRDLIHWLNPDDEAIGAILDRRLDLAAIDLGLNLSSDHYRPFFEGRHVKIPTTDNEFRFWPDFIVKRSRERPRDGVQFISALIDTALESEHKLITSDDVTDSIVAYSNERVEDLEREVGEECPQIREIVRSFAYLQFDEGSFKLKAETLYKHLAGIPSRFGLQFMDKTLHPGRDELNVFTLWRYLHEIGFLNARALDATKPKGFKHILLQDDASLVSKERWNQVQTLMWEVHPAYRDYLITVQRERDLAAEVRKEEAGQRPRKSSVVRHKRRR